MKATSIGLTLGVSISHQTVVKIKCLNKLMRGMTSINVA
jgi:hypothetical protein